MADETGQTDGTTMSVGEGKTMDITGDGGVLKEVLVVGTGDEMPQKDDEVYMHDINGGSRSTNLSSEHQRCL